MMSSMLDYFKKYVFDISHLLLELLQTIDAGDTIAKLEKIFNL